MSARAKLGLIALVVGLILMTDVAVHLGAAITPTGDTYAWHPITLATELVREKSWPPAATFLVVVVAVLAVAILIVTLVRSAGGTTVDKMQRHLLAGNNVSGLLQKARRRESTQLHPNAAGLPVGERLGRLVGSRGKWVLQGWRELGVYIFGTGRGKTSSLVIRHVIEAVGAAIMTTNKVDGVREVLAGRKGMGEHYVFDPQRIYRHEGRPDFVFNPLSQVESITDAKELASIFEASTRKASDKGGDAQFDSMGRDLLAYFFFAAALDREPLSEVYRWLTEGRGTDVQSILRRHSKIGPAAAIEGILGQPDRTKGSVYATAQRMASALADDELLAWTSAPGVRTFRPEYFITSTDTLVLLSKDGEGSGGAILTCLVRAICKTAEHAAQQNGGRLRVPIVAELDECANIVRWPELPSVYSFYGSMGIMLNAYFQSWSQGVDAFGSSGMQTLWDAAAIRVYGGGSGDTEFLGRLSKAVGEYDEQMKNTSSGSGGHYSTSTNTRRRPILSVDDLASLPTWRALVLSSIARPVLIETVPWFRDKELRAAVDGVPSKTRAAIAPVQRGAGEEPVRSV